MRRKRFAKAVEALDFGMGITATDLQQSATEHEINDELIRESNA